MKHRSMPGDKLTKEDIWNMLDVWYELDEKAVKEWIHRKCLHSIRYLVFAFDWYYPKGGAEDLIGMTSDYGEARGIVERCRRTYGGDSAQILDLVTGRIEIYNLREDGVKVMDVNSVIALK